MAKLRSRNKPNPSGRNSYRRHSQWDHVLLQSGAYRSLTPNARALLIELTMIYNGSNNGSIALSRADATARMGLVDEKAAGKAFEELAGVGLIVMAKDAHFQTKADERRAREWRLTWLPISGRSGPTNDYLQWQANASTPAGKRAAKRSDLGLRAIARPRKRPAQKQISGEDSPSMPLTSPQSMALAGEDSTPPNLKTT